MTREDLIQAIAADLNIEGGMSTTDAAISAIATIEALGLVIVPRVPDDEMIRAIDAAWVSAVNRDPLLSARTSSQAEWDGAIAGAPLYRDEVKG